MEKRKVSLWVISGFIALLAMSGYGVIRTLATEGGAATVLDLIYLVIDWVAACTPYFFFGAAIGYLIERFLLKRKNLDKNPIWLYLTFIFWLVTTLITVVFAKSDIVSPVLKWIFPFAFGIFFTGMFFATFLPEVIVKSYLGKLIFDIIFLAVFAGWFYLEKRGIKKFARILLFLLFTVFFLGFAGCASKFI